MSQYLECDSGTQVRPGAAPLNELQSQLNDMLDDSASDDVASLSQFNVLQAPLQQPASTSSPIVRQATSLTAASLNNMQMQSTSNSPQPTQQGSLGTPQQANEQNAQIAQLRAQLQVCSDSMQGWLHADNLVRTGFL